MDTPTTPRHGEVNMRDVALRAGVSIATVSRTLRGLPGVGPETRQRVRDIAEELSYVVSPAASSLSRRETGRVAIVVPKLDSWFASNMTAGIESVVRGADRDILLYQVDGEAQRSRFFRDLPTRRKVDAVVLVSLPILAHEEERLDLMGVQVVVVVVGARLRDFPYVDVDDVAIAVAAVEHLVDLGHTRIGMIRTSDTDGAHWTSDVHRCRGYHDALAAQGLVDEPGLLVTETYGLHAGARGLARLLSQPDPPTAVFCYSDDIAVSALREAGRRGVRVPEDLSLIGVDGNPLAELFELDTVDQHVGDQARLAGEMTLALLNGDQPAAAGVTIDFDLVVRSSTAPPPGR